MEAKIMPNKANTVPGSDNGGLDGFIFDLPPVSKTEAGFIDDDGEDTPQQQNTTSETPRQTEQGPRGLRSRAGDTFDPSIHHMPPSETKTGKWRRKRKGASTISSDGETIPSNESYAMQAQKLAVLYGDSHRFLFGEGGKVRRIDDLLPLRDSLQDYMQENSLREIPPTYAVLLNSFIYTLSVAQRPENESVISRWKERVSNLWYWLRGKRPAKKVEKQTETSAEKPEASTPRSNGLPLPSNIVY